MHRNGIFTEKCTAKISSVRFMRVHIVHRNEAQVEKRVPGVAGEIFSMEETRNLESCFPGMRQSSQRRTNFRH